MMVPRAYRFSSSPPRDACLDEKSGGRLSTRKSTPVKADVTLTARPPPAERTATEPAKTVSKPMAVPLPERSHSGTVQTLPSRSRKMSAKVTSQAATLHDGNALPPAVAALLAITAIPRPRPNQFRRHTRRQRRVSIDELVSSWKSDESLKPSYSSSPALSILLEDASDMEETPVASLDSAAEEGFLYQRSESCESVPSLDGDDRSVLSLSGPRTPESLRSQKSSSNLRRDKSRLSLTRQDTSFDHPLVPAAATAPDEDDLMLSTPDSRSATPKPKSTFTSNLTTSLRAFKNATLSSIASFTLSNVTAPSQRASDCRFSDEMLWSHPFLFPRLSSEMRPAIEGIPTEAQRRYLNPPPLTFEEQEAPFQLALHAPFLAERIDETPTIPMQTYNRGKKASQKRAAGLDPSSEAGRALLGPSGVRQREPRENSDFLRVVVLEMNMRRKGKLESGRARIWLPPRQSSRPSEESAGLPTRWLGMRIDSSCTVQRVWATVAQDFEGVRAKGLRARRAQMHPTSRSDEWADEVYDWLRHIGEARRGQLANIRFKFESIEVPARLDYYQIDPLVGFAEYAAQTGTECTAVYTITGPGGCLYLQLPLSGRPKAVSGVYRSTVRKARLLLTTDEEGRKDWRASVAYTTALLGPRLSALETAGDVAGCTFRGRGLADAVGRAKGMVL
ncbi:hypothetical protein B0A55_09426 [Friedmanniomyces simplex]|uniref:Uncharacterized protein n=1 Tax=Friedmanniomyces simplex TaxID=329884 RepID=A0A4U0WRW1_9PEZI|nr:hypothetical protein B0A55_09426 [Friedmanniomyces simplex]